MGKVHVNDQSVSGGDAFHAAGHTHVFHGMDGGVVDGNAGLDGHRHGSRRVGDVECTRHRQFERAEIRTIHGQDEAHAVIRIGAGEYRQVRVAAGRIAIQEGILCYGNTGHGRGLHQQTVVVAGGIQHERLAVGDDLTLAIEVILERRVLDVTDVVGGDVQECSDIEGQAVHAVDLVGLGGDLHNQVTHAMVDGLAHHPERIQRFGRGQFRRGIGAAVQACLFGGEQGGAVAAVGIQNGVSQVSRGGFPFGAGDADNGQAVLWTAVELRRQQAHRLMHVVYDQAGGGGAVGMVGLCHIRGQTALIDAIKEFRTEPSFDEQHRPRFYAARVVGD